MKTKRFVAVILCLAAILFLLTSCSGFNSKMRKHLSDAANYKSCRGVICDVYYLDAENKKVSLLGSEEIPECDVVIELTFDDRETVRRFLGAEPNPEQPLEEYRIQFDITKENHQILAENGFYNIASVNTPVEITASDYIYMDSEFFFVAAVTCNEAEYLRFETGIQNIQEYMDELKSLL